MILLTAFAPSLLLSTVTSQGRGSGFSETGLGVDVSYFLNGNSAISAHYELNFGLKVKSLLVNGISFGYTGYLSGGRSEVLSRDTLRINAWPRFSSWYFLGVAQRHFDFSAFDVDRNSVLYAEKKPVSSGDVIAPEFQCGFDASLSSQVRVGLRVSVYQSLVADEDFSLLAAGGALSVGYAL